MTDAGNSSPGPARRFYEGLHRLLGALVAVAILFVTVGISLDVLMRNTGFGSISWMLEATEYSLFAATFLGAPWVLHLGDHVRIDMVVGKLPPRAGWIAEIVTDLFGLAISILLFWYALDVTLTASRDGALVIKELIFPEWWIFSVVVLSAALLCLEFTLRLIRVVSAGRPMAADSTGGGF